MFTDETKSNWIGSDERQWVWKRAGAPLQSQHILQTIKFGGGNVMIWGCMTTTGVGLMCRTEGKMDAELYEEILEDHAFQTLEYYDLNSSNFIFQQDNDPKHTSKRAKNGLKTMKLSS